MLRKAMLCALAWGISGSLFLGTGFCDENAKDQRQIEKTIRKYHRLVEKGKDERAKRLAEVTAKNHPKSQAAKLLKKYSELLAKSPGGRLTPTVDAPNASNADDTLITAEITIVDVPETFFEQLGIDCEMILPQARRESFERIEIDFDFNPPKRIGYADAEPIGVDVRAVPQPDPSEPPRLELVAAEEPTAHRVLSPLETLFLQRAMRHADCQVLSRPRIRTLPNQPAKIEVNGQDGKFTVEFVGNLSKDGKHLALNVDGESQNHSAQIDEILPLGKTLLLSLGSHVIEGRAEHAPPILSKVSYVSRLFKNTGIGWETRHRLVFITPQVVKVPKSSPVAPPARN